MPDVAQRPCTRLRWSVAVASLVVWLSACGPGVGGTGTGEIKALGYFGATAASVCSADVGVLLGCRPGTDAASPAPSATPILLADALLAPRVQARVQDSMIELTAPCAGVRFVGQWADITGQGASFVGSIGPDGGFTPGTLQAQLSGAGVQVTLRDAHGGVLFGPALLQVVPAVTAPGACG